MYPCTPSPPSTLCWTKPLTDVLRHRVDPALHVDGLHEVPHEPGGRGSVGLAVDLGRPVDRGVPVTFS